LSVLFDIKVVSEHRNIDPHTDDVAGISLEHDGETELYILVVELVHSRVLDRLPNLVFVDETAVYRDGPNLLLDDLSNFFDELKNKKVRNLLKITCCTMVALMSSSLFCFGSLIFPMVPPFLAQEMYSSKSLSTLIMFLSG
jgi:hypothetical protein